MSTVWTLLRKELLLERKVPQVVPAMALFTVTTFVVFHFALQRRAVDGDLAAGVLVVTLLFAAMLGVNRLFVADREEGGFDGFLLAPVDRTALLVAKAATFLAFLLLLDEPRANLDPQAGALVEPLIGAASGRTRVVTSHDPAGGLAEADLALGLRGGRAELLAAAAEVSRDDIGALYA